MLYVAPVALIAMWSPPGHASLVVIIAAMCTALTVGKLAYFSLEPIAWATVSNHVLAVCALWTIVLVSLVRKRREQRGALDRCVAATVGLPGRTGQIKPSASGMRSRSGSAKPVKEWRR